MFAIGQRVITSDGPGAIRNTSDQCIDAYERGFYLIGLDTGRVAYYTTSEITPEPTTLAPTTRERIDAVLATLATMQVELAAIQAALTPEEPR